MTGRVIDLMATLVDSLKSPSSPSASTAPLTFPRASGEQCAGYFGFYRRDCKPIMRRWVSRVMAEHAAYNEEPRTEGFGYVVAELEAKREIGRELNPHERKLLGESVRDWAVSRAAMLHMEDRRS